MDVQQAAEAANFTSYQMQSSFGAHEAQPGRIEVMPSVAPYTRAQLKKMGYSVEVVDRREDVLTVYVPEGAAARWLEAGSAPVEGLTL